MVIFTAGLLTGGMLAWRLQQSAVNQRPVHRPPQPASPAFWRFEFLRRAQRELDLSVEQRQSVDKILKESQERTRAIMEPVEPQIRAEMQRTKEQFRALLTPEQQKRFEELIKKPIHQKRPPGTTSKPGQTNNLQTNAP